jgi:hypothetical protein
MNLRSSEKLCSHLLLFIVPLIHCFVEEHQLCETSRLRLLGDLRPNPFHVFTASCLHFGAALASSHNSTSEQTSCCNINSINSTLEQFRNCSHKNNLYIARGEHRRPQYCRQHNFCSQMYLHTKLSPVEFITLKTKSSPRLYVFSYLHI